MNDVLEFTMRDIFVPYEKTAHWHQEDKYRFLPGRHAKALEEFILSCFFMSDPESYNPEQVIMTSEKVFIVFPMCTKYEDRPDSLEMAQVHLEHAFDEVADIDGDWMAEHEVELRSYDWDLDLDSGLRTNY